MDISKEELIQKAKELATPIDFDQLIQKGLLIKRGKGWYEVPHIKKLPKHVGEKINRHRSERSPEGYKNLVKFASTKEAAKLYKRVTGKSI